MFKWYGNDRVERKGNLFDNIGTGAILPRQNSGAMLDFVHTLSSTTMVNSAVRLDPLRRLRARARARGFDMTTIGFPASLAAASINAGAAAGDLRRHHDVARDRTGGNRAGAGFYDGVRFLPVVHLGDQRAEGAHALKVGADLRFLRESSDQLTATPPAPTPSARSGRAGRSTTRPARRTARRCASFLLGLPTAGQFEVKTDGGQPRSISRRLLRPGRLAHAHPSLTLNLGLRYERETGTTERQRPHARRLR